MCRKMSRTTKIIKQLTIHLIVFLLFDSILIAMAYGNYKEKVDLLSALVSQQDTTKAVTSILKGEVLDHSKGELFLNEYGFNLNRDNAIYNRFLMQCGIIIGVSVLPFGAEILFYFVMEQKKRKKEIAEVKQLETIVSNYRREEFESSNISFEIFSNGELEKLYLEIEALGNTLQLLHKKMRIEKEETKSLVTDISHQLKTPVAALKTSFEILQNENLTKEEQIEFTERCNMQLRGIENLLSALVNISRMESGLITIRPEENCLFDTILESVNRVYEKAVDKRISIELDADETVEELIVLHDPKWIAEALINILENAIKYSPKDTSITIRVIKMTTFMRIEIEDQGIGIPKDEYNKVFQRFFRGSLKEVKQESGSGVGLYLTREIINRHHGTIRVSSGKLGTGTIFTIQLPK